MALEHPQKQYRYSQDDEPICIILSSQEQGIYLLNPLLCSKQEFTALGGANKKKSPHSPTVVYQADRTIMTN